MNFSVLLLDDDKGFTQALAEDFAEKNYTVTICHSIKDIPQKHFDYAVVDLRLVGELGLNSLQKILAHNPSCHIVILTGYGSVATAVEAVKMGALNYLHKPISFDVLEAALKNELKSDQIEDKVIKSLHQQEHEYIEFVLTQNKGNITKTAKQLGLHRQSLQRKLKKFPN